MARCQGSLPARQPQKGHSIQRITLRRDNPPGGSSSTHASAGRYDARPIGLTRALAIGTPGEHDERRARGRAGLQSPACASNPAQYHRHRREQDALCGQSSLSVSMIERNWLVEASSRPATPRR